jgi:hypothetical protein
MSLVEGQGAASRASASRTGNDSGVAPQAIEIAQNGLGDPSARGCREGESLRAHDNKTSLGDSVAIDGAASVTA